MGLLHARGQEGLPAALWELAQLAQAAGLPQPPPLTLPVLPLLGTSCDLTALRDLLGEAAANTLGQQLQQPAVQDLLTGNLTGLREQLLTYLSTLDAQQARVNAEQAETQGTQGALGQAQDYLTSLRSALGAPPGEPLPAELISAVAAACPAVGGMLTYAEGTLGNVAGTLASADAAASALSAKAAALTTLRGKAEALLTRIDAHVEQQAALITALNGLNFTGGA